MKIECKKAWFGKYKFKIYVRVMDINIPSNDVLEFINIRKWIEFHTPYIKLEPINPTLSQLVYEEYIIKLKIDDAILFKLEFMT